MFEGAFVRKIAYLLAALLFAYFFGTHRAHAQTAAYVWQSCGYNGNTTSWSSVSACATFVAQNYTPGASGSVYDAGTCGTAPSGPNASGYLRVTVSSGGSNVYGPGPGGSFTGTCTGSATPVNSNPNNCSTGTGSLNIFTAIQQNQGGISGPVGNYCVGGCSYANSGSSVIVSGQGCSGATGNASDCVGATSRAIPTGNSCGSSDGSTPATPGNCFTDARGNVLCSSADGTTASVNSDVINPSSAGGPGSCKGYGDGAAACVVSMTVPAASPPVPSTPTSATTPAAPDAVVTPTAAQAAGGAGTVNYYSPGTVAAGKGNTVTSNGSTGSNPAGTSPGATTGIGTSGSGGTGDSGTQQTQACVPSAMTQCGDAYSGGADCTAPPACTGDAVACGVVNQSWLSRCASTDSAAMASAVALNPGESPAGSTLDVSGSITDVGGPISSSGGTSCPAPPTVSVLGHSMTFDFMSYVCRFASAISSVVMILAYMAAATIWFKGILA